MRILHSIIHEINKGNCSVQELSNKLKIEKALVEDALKILVDRGYLKDTSNYGTDHSCLGCGKCKNIVIGGICLAIKQRKSFFKNKYFSIF